MLDDVYGESLNDFGVYRYFFCVLGSAYFPESTMFV